MTLGKCKDYVFGMKGYNMYTHTDYKSTYGRIMQFNKNKREPIHRWYPFVEGYSREFIKSIIDEMPKKNLICLEPFSGSGTTTLELQNNGIPCYAFEVNPLMYLISRVKLEKSYSSARIDYWLDYVIKNRKIENVVLPSEFPTLYENNDNNRKKWNYSSTVGKSIEKLKIAINSIDEITYKELFKVALASILLEVSNLYRNGKCLSYKKNWENNTYTEEEVFQLFDNKIKKEIKPDIEMPHIHTDCNNKDMLFNEDSRIGIQKRLNDSSVDLVITSPPYLNSRDYTDTYMLELKTLDLTRDSKAILDLRKKTIRSHVQIKWNDTSAIDNELLKKTISSLNEASSGITKWNDSLIDMVRLYFVDMHGIFMNMYRKMKNGGRVFFNVSNSAYFNVLINTLEICTSIAESVGFRVIEIRDARELKTSPQQQEKVGKLLEGVIVLEK